MTVVVFTLETRSGIQTAPPPPASEDPHAPLGLSAHVGGTRGWTDPCSGRVRFSNLPQSQAKLRPEGRRTVDVQTDKHTDSHPSTADPRDPEQGDEESSKASPDPLLPPETTAFCSLGSWPTGQSPECGLCLRKGPSEP